MWRRARWELRRGPRSAVRKVAGMIVRHGEAASRIEGADLTRFMGILSEYLDFVEKVDKRRRDEE